MNVPSRKLIFRASKTPDVKTQNLKSAPCNTPQPPPNSTQAQAIGTKAAFSGGKSHAKGKGTTVNRMVVESGTSTAQAQQIQAKRDAQSERAGAEGLANPSTPRTWLRTRARGWRKKFLQHLAQSANITGSARMVGVSRDAIYRLRYKDSEFNQAIEAAIAEANDLLDLEARRRAVEGVKRPVFMHDENKRPIQVGEVVEYSDKLMEVLLRGNLPSKYGKQALELSGPGGTPLAVPMAPVSVQILIPSNGREILTSGSDSLVQVQPPSPALPAPLANEAQPAPPAQQPESEAKPEAESPAQPEKPLDPRLDGNSPHYVPACFRSPELMRQPTPKEEPKPTLKPSGNPSPFGPTGSILGL